MDLREVANQVTTLAALRQFASAFDPSYCCAKATALRFEPSAGGGALAFLEAETRAPRFRVHEKSLSLHKERSVLDARNGLPVATLRLALLHRTPTYSAYARTEHEETPETFTFALERGARLRMEFHDLVADARSVLGCDPVPPADAQSSGSEIEFWLVRGGSDEVRESVARVRYENAKAGPPDGKAPRAGVLEVAKGVDLMMMVLICLALDEQRHHKAPSP